FALRADFFAALVAQAASDLHLADLAIVQELDGVLGAGVRTRLRAGLADLLVLASGFNNAAAFADVVADRLFDVHILAGLNGPIGGQGVPVIWCSDADDINSLVFQYLAKVGNPLRRALTLADFGDSLFTYFAIDVADVQNF